MRYTLKQSSPSTWTIQTGRTKVGSVVYHSSNGYAASVSFGKRGTVQYTSSIGATDAFRECIAIQNRIDLCGKNDKALAQKALEARNEQIRQEVKKRNEELASLAPGSGMKWVCRNRRKIMI